MSNAIFSNIPALGGIDNLEAIIERWKLLPGSRQADDSAQAVALPGMLWVTDHGIGQSNILEQISEYLCVNEIMRFKGKEKHLEFTFEYCPPEKDNTEIKRFIERTQRAAGFKYEYRGVVCVDITQWAGHEDEKHFKTFLEYLGSRSDRCLIILSIVSRDNADMRDIEHTVMTHLRIDKVTLKMPGTQQLFKYVESRLKKRGIAFSDVSKKMLTQSVGEMRNSKAFAGLNTLDKLCDEIACEVYMAGNPKNTVTKEVASKFSVGSAYIERAKYKKEKTRAIGFAGGQNER